MKVQWFLAYGWGLSLVVASAWPALLDPDDDSYPLSTYPMFSRHRGQPIVHRMVGIERDGSERTIEPHLVANSETLQAAASISNAVYAGESAAKRFCKQVASRVQGDLGLSSIRSLEIRSVRFDPIRYFTVSKEPLESKRVTRCRVRGRRR